MKKILGVLLVLLFIPLVAAVQSPRLSPSSCLVEGENYFRVTAVAQSLPAEWKLFNANTSTEIMLGYMNVGDVAGNLSTDEIIITEDGGYWGKSYWNENTSQWVQVGDLDEVSVALFTSWGRFCEPDPQVPEFGVVAAGIALIGAVAIFAFKRKN